MSEDVDIEVKEEVKKVTKVKKDVKVITEVKNVDPSSGLSDMDDTELSKELTKRRRESFNGVIGDINKMSGIDLWKANRESILTHLNLYAANGMNICKWGDLSLPNGDKCKLQEAYSKLSSHLNNLQLRSHIKSNGSDFFLEISWMA